MQIAHILFDLDNTLYPNSVGIMQMFDKRITEYVQNFLSLDEAAAAEVRNTYFHTYGTTLRGLQQHYTVDVEHYLSYVHELDLEAFLALDAELDALLSRITARKSIFTNSPIEHAQRVLKVLGIEHHFDHIFDLRFHTFDPKPSRATYHRVLDALGLDGSAVVFVEDTAQNLMPASELGMTTILLSDKAYDQTTPPADYVVADILAALRVVLELEASLANHQNAKTPRPHDS
jgi:putative hydrolase of the HAD superfamily